MTDRLGPNNNTRHTRTGDIFFTLASLLIGILRSVRRVWDSDFLFLHVARFQPLPAPTVPIAPDNAGQPRTAPTAISFWCHAHRSGFPVVLMLVKVVDGPEPNAACPIIVVTQEGARRGSLAPHGAVWGGRRSKVSFA